MQSANASITEMKAGCSLLICLCLAWFKKAATVHLCWWTIHLCNAM